LRDLVVNSEAHGVDPMGILLQGADVLELDLADIESKVSVRLGYCRIGRIDLCRSSFPFLNFHDSRIRSLEADSFDCKHDLYLGSTQFESYIELTDGNIGGCLVLDGASLINLEGGGAIRAARLRVSKAALLRDIEILTNSRHASVYMRSATIEGELAFDGASICNFAGPTVDMQFLTTGAEILLQDVSIRSNSAAASVDFSNAQVRHRIYIGPAEIHNSSGGIFDLNGTTIGNSVDLSRVQASSGGGRPMMSSRGAKVGGNLHINETIFAGTGPAVAGDRLNVAGSCVIASSSVTVASDEPAIKLDAGSVGGPFDIVASYVVNEQDSALTAQGAVIGIRFYVLDFCHLESGTASALDLDLAEIGGPVIIQESVVKSTGGPGFSCVRLKASAILIGPAVYVVGHTKFSAAILAGVLIDDQVAVRRSRFVNMNPMGTNLHLGGGTIGGTFELAMAAVQSAKRRAGVVILEGLEYPRVPQGATLREWIDLLATGTMEYEAQPYRQLAKGYKELGDEGAARAIGIAQNRDRGKRGSMGGGVQRFGHGLSGLLLGYGYKPWRALVGLVIVLAATSVLVVVAGRLGLLVLASAPTRSCNLAEQLSVALPSAGPILRSSGTASCIYARGQWAQAFILANYVLQLAGWAFVTLFIAGFTGLIKKE